MNPEELRAEIDRLKAELATLKTEHSTLKTENANLTKDASSYKDDLKKAQADLKKASDDRDAATAKADKSTADATKAHEDLAGVQAELKDVRAEARDRRHEAKALTTQVTELAAARDEWKGKAEALPQDQEQKIAALTGEIRDIKHKAAFGKVAKTLEVSDEARQRDLWALTGYKPESDEVDETKLTTLIGEALKGRPWLVDAKPAPAVAPAPAPGSPPPGTPPAAPPAKVAGKIGGNTPPGPGSDRGQSVESESQTKPRDRPVGSFQTSRI